MRSSSGIVFANPFSVTIDVECWRFSSNTYYYTWIGRWTDEGTGGRSEDYAEDDANRIEDALLLELFVEVYGT